MILLSLAPTARRNRTYIELGRGRDVVSDLLIYHQGELTRRTPLYPAHVAGPLHPMTLLVWGVFALIALADALPRI